MKNFLAVVLLCVPVFGQAVYTGSGQSLGGGVWGGAVGSGTFYAQPPQMWVHNFIQPDTQPSPICDPPGGVYPEADVTLSTLTVAGLQSAMNLWAGGYRRIKIPAGTLLNSSTYHTASGTSPLGLSYSQSTLIDIPAISSPTGCLVVESATPPTRYRTLCADFPPNNTRPRNPGCVGEIANLWTIRQDDNPGGVGKSAIYFPPGSSHVVIRDFEATVLPGSSQSGVGGSHGRTPIMADQESHDVGIEYAYIHGWDPGDAGQPAGACAGWTMTGTVNTSGTTVTWGSGKRFGATFSDGVNLYGQTYTNPQATITINGIDYQIASGGHDPAASDTTLTLGTSAGTQTGIAYSLTNPIAKYANGCGDDLMNAIDWSADNSWIMWGYIEKNHYWQTEGHSISLGFQNGPVKIAHNWIESGSGGTFIGGGPVDTRLGPVAHVEMRDNYMGHDLNWKWLTGGQGHSPKPPWGCGPLDGNSAHDTCPFQWDIKNSFEAKFCVSCLMDGNIIEGSWTDGQNGLPMGWAPRNCSGGAICGIFDQNGLPRAGFKNIRISNNWIRAGAEVTTLGGRSDGPGNGGGLSMPTGNFDVVNNVFSNFDINEFGDPAGSHSNLLLDLGSQGQTYLCAMSRTSGVAHAACAGASSIAPDADNGIASIARTGTPGVTGGTVTVAFAAGSESQRHDPMIGGTASISGNAGWNGSFTINGAKDGGVTTPCSNNATPWIPPTNLPCVGSTGRYANQFTYIDTANTQVAATDTLCGPPPAPLTCSTANIGTDVLAFQTLAYSITDISVGDPVLVLTGTYTPAGNGNHPKGGMGCTDNGAAGYPTASPTASAYAGSYTALPTAISPTNPAGLDVYYPNPGPDESTGIQCYLDNGAGSARNVTFAQNTIVNSSPLAIQNGHFYNQETNNKIFNNLYIAPDNSTGYCAGKKSFFTMGTACEGAPSITSLDPLTAGVYGNVLMGRSAVDWAAVPSGSAANQFPATFADVGFATTQANQFTFCDNSLAPFNCPQMSLPWADNLKLSDLTLAPSSPYLGKGTNIPALSAAFTSTQYMCPAGLSCGTSGGPYKDAP